MQLFDISDAIGQTLTSTGSKSYSNTVRVPFVFTSTRRLRLLGINSEISLTDPDFFTTLTTPNQTINELPVIEMMINPNSIDWSQPKRIVKRDVQEGSVYFHFTNTRGENNDILVASFRGNTGNINPRGSVKLQSSEQITSNDVDTGAFKKLIVWHNLWNLTREPILLPDGTINEFLIVYNSTTIPFQISLVGIFNEVLKFTESSDKPFSRDYSFSFSVQEVVPPLEDIVNEIQTSMFDPTPERTTGLA
jgi:hypothetical protein